MDVLSTVVQDALQDLIEAVVTARLGGGLLGTLSAPERDAERVAPEDGVDSGAGR